MPVLSFADRENARFSSGEKKLTLSHCLVYPPGYDVSGIHKMVH
jgi:hypothetical protein